MDCEIITIGNELISGKTCDTNSFYAAERLTSSGIKVARITSTGDDSTMVSEALKRAVKASNVVIVTGGLGSTDDDITNEIGAKTLNRQLCLNKQMFELIKGRVEARGIELTPSIEKMAWMPEGSKVINPNGPGCGFRLIEKDVHIYFLPGVPAEMRNLLNEFVLPEILSLSKALPVVRQRILRLYGLSEPDIAEIFKEMKGKTGDVIFGFYPHFPENHMTLSLGGKDEQTVTKDLDRVEDRIRDLLGPFIFSSDNKSMEKVVGEALKDKGLTISVAESCTGGLIGHRLTDVPGSSAYFLGGAMVYSNQSKVGLLKVHPETIETFGAVSDKTAREMAQGVKERMNSDIGLAVTGIAGPDGGSEEKPVGTVFMALAAKDKVLSGEYRFWGSRKQIKMNTSTMVLDWVRRYLNGNPFLPGI